MNFDVESLSKPFQACVFTFDQPCTNATFSSLRICHDFAVDTSQLHKLCMDVDDQDRMFLVRASQLCICLELVSEALG